MESNTPNEGECVSISVNKETISVSKGALTGEQVLSSANLDTATYDLFLVEGQNSTRIPGDESCEIKDAMQFHAILRSVPYG